MMAIKKYPKLFVIAVALLAASFSACQQKQFTENSKEIDVVKTLIGSIGSEMDQTVFEKSYADSAQVFWNSLYPLPWKESFLALKETLKAQEDGHFLDGPVYEQVINDKGETWVGFWGVWQAQIKNTDRVIQMPVHLTYRFEEGRIVEETGYWDNHIIIEAIENTSNYELE